MPQMVSSNENQVGFLTLVAEVVLAPSPIAGRALGAGAAMLVWSLTDPVAPGERHHGQHDWVEINQYSNVTGHMALQLSQSPLHIINSTLKSLHFHEVMKILPIVPLANKSLGAVWKTRACSALVFLSPSFIIFLS